MLSEKEMTTSMMIRTYNELICLGSFEERFKYLVLHGEVSEVTFGFNRYLNQALYRSYEWKEVRDEVIIRDNAFDLGVDGHDIFEKVIVHHMNPITLEQIESHDPTVFDPNYLICCSHNTHNAIHYGDKRYLDQMFKPVKRCPGDTIPWKRRW